MWVLITAVPFSPQYLTSLNFSSWELLLSDIYLDINSNFSVLPYAIIQLNNHNLYKNNSSSVDYSPRNNCGGKKKNKEETVKNLAKECLVGYWN